MFAGQPELSGEFYENLLAKMRGMYENGQVFTGGEKILKKMREKQYKPGLHLCVKLDQFRRGFVLRENVYKICSIS
jgi:hypothetical protein